MNELSFAAKWACAFWFVAGILFGSFFTSAASNMPKQTIQKTETHIFEK